MTWFDWTLVAFLVLNAVTCIALVGQPRKPILPGTAALVTLLDGAFVFGILATRGAL